VVSLFTTETKYTVYNHACDEASWLMKLCSYVGLSYVAIIVQCDNNSVICLAKNPTFHVKTKHIDIKYHFIKGMVEDGKMILEKVDTR
jgi:hypothetical protein